MSIYFYGCVSLDGYLADSHHRIDWLHETGTPEETSYQEFYDKMDITIMGRKTYDETSSMSDFDSYYEATENYVFTHREGLDSETFTPISGDVTAFVKQFPKEKNIWIIGGNQLIASLLDENLIDTLIVQFAPVLLGDGIPLFTQQEGIKRYTLKEVHQYGQFAELVLEKPNPTKIP
ncbi:dihydrofolate reductase family protein [Enterococcus sp. LJL128]|uniref:dihydrofolate reductase family protein n=1 Tax=Enterococcus sp. LJL51 TaxID=3416656 RepID=UPI003CF3A2B9